MIRTMSALLLLLLDTHSQGYSSCGCSGALLAVVIIYITSQEE